MELGILCSPHLAVAHCFGLFYWHSSQASLSANWSASSKIEAPLCVLCQVHGRMGTFVCLQGRELSNCLEFQGDKTGPFIDSYANMCSNSKWRELCAKVTH
jgi:hypothetical protein